MTFAMLDQGRWRSSGALPNFIWALVRILAALWFRESVAHDAVMVVGDPDREGAAPA